MLSVYKENNELRARMQSFNDNTLEASTGIVSTHPLTGKVDEGYRLHLTQRYAGLMEQLNQLGYKKTLHPLFTEFIINTFGILKERPGQNSIQAMDYNNPDILRKLIKIGAPKKLQEALLIVLTCLCDMAEKDKKPLLIR
ncbi:hypothetical protein F2P81_001858 [Scophthalmus maximus]|uniref:Speriolin C-terminal domain-containing protein n=1 Tax=Scophthalmus maximus TaxID=52904 RepID=A0A6A4TKI8_SCOMX|nr:hypothetical protein F2P81_001858 [Scophthalmus maximus]